MSGNKIIQLQYIEEDWKTLELMAHSKGSASFRTYLNNRIHHLARVYREMGEREKANACLDCVKRPNNYIIPPDISKELTELAGLYCIPVTFIIRRLIADPLLKENFESIYL